MCLIPPIFFVVVDKMYWDFSMTRRDKRLVDRTKGLKMIKVVDFLQLQDLSILPVGVSIISIKNHYLLIVTRNIHSKIDPQCIILMLSLGSLEEAVNLISVLDVSTDLLPSRLVYEVIITCLLVKLDWIIDPHH